MKAPKPEFSRLVPIARLGSEPFRVTIEATPEERLRLAQRFDLLSLDRLAAAAVVQRVDGESIRLDAALEAQFEQSCVVTLDPVPGRVAETFSMMYGRSAGEEAEIDINVEEPVFEPLSGDAIDIGEAVAQELSLALPEFPRSPDAELDPVDACATEENPFAVLERLRRSSD